MPHSVVPIWKYTQIQLLLWVQCEKVWAMQAYC